MKFKINYSRKYEDSFIVEGETIEEIKTKVKQERKKRKWAKKYCWSEEIR